MLAARMMTMTERKTLHNVETLGVIHNEITTAVSGLDNTGGQCHAQASGRWMVIRDKWGRRLGQVAVYNNIITEAEAPSKDVHDVLKQFIGAIIINDEKAPDTKPGRTLHNFIILGQMTNEATRELKHLPCAYGECYMKAVRSNRLEGVWLVVYNKYGDEIGRMHVKDRIVVGAESNRPSVLEVLQKYIGCNIITERSCRHDLRHNGTPCQDPEL